MLLMGQESNIDLQSFKNHIHMHYANWKARQGY